jgi:glycosyltransferase involved in cell wall biosynthesis
MTPKRILVDLKPALDGYAGIPQESRLLFANLLRRAQSFEVEGLLQHGGAALHGGIKDTSVTGLKPEQRVMLGSKFVASFYGSGKGDFYGAIKKIVTNFLQAPILRFKLALGRRLHLGTFEGSLFEDFLWSHFFSKSLQSEQKALVTSARQRILSPSRRSMHKIGIPLVGWHHPSFPTIDTRGYDFLIAQTPFPGRVTTGSRLVVRYHDAVPVLMPHTIGDLRFHQASHFYALRDNVASGAWFACISEATRQDLLKLFPEVENRAVVIHNMVSADYFIEETTREHAKQVIWVRIHNDPKEKASIVRPSLDKDVDFPYLLMVSTLEPRKNHQLLLSAWESLKFTSMPNLKLVIVGGTGWGYKPILDRFRPWQERGELFHLSNVPAAELRVLYSHAAATICPSVAEGFDYSGIEAMGCGGLVIASDIPVHREIFKDGAAYFDPYSVDDASAQIARLLNAEGAKEADTLRGAGSGVISHFAPEKLLDQWTDFFNRAALGANPNFVSGIAE